MTEATRGWIYRLVVLALVALIIILRPDRFVEWMPYIFGLVAGGLATSKTSIRRR